MSVRSITRVWERSRQSGSELLMLLAIADFADDDGQAYPAVSTLATKCRMQLRNAQYVLGALKASGELEIRPNEGPRGTNLYRITLPEGVQPVAPLQSIAPMQPSSRGGATQCAKGVQPIAPEPSLNRQEPGRARARKTSMPEDFAVSERVQAWATEKGFGRLDEHLEAFRGKALANGYTYLDWDQALMNAIRADWAKLNGAGAARAQPAEEVAFV